MRIMMKKEGTGSYVPPVINGYEQLSVSSYILDSQASYDASKSSFSLVGVYQTPIANYSVPLYTTLAYKGLFTPPSTGDYTFTGGGDDAWYLFIGPPAANFPDLILSQAVVSVPGLHGHVTNSTTITLDSTTEYSFVLLHGNNAGDGSIDISTTFDGGNISIESLLRHDV